MKLYNFTKDDTEIIDQRTSGYSVKLKSSKQTIYVFSYTLYVAPVNASTIVLLNKKFFLLNKNQVNPSNWHRS